MAKRNSRTISLSVLYTLIATLALAFFIKALGIIAEGWFARNALMILIISGVILAVFIILGVVSLRNVASRGAGLVPK